MTLESQLSEVGLIVVDTAAEIFRQCGASSDFCIQAIYPTGAVFGGTNRLIWHAVRGFRPDRSYCTSRFLAAFDALYPPDWVAD